MTRFHAAVAKARAATEIPAFANEAEFQSWIVRRAYEAGWGISGPADKSRDAEAVALGWPPMPLDGLVFHPRIMYRTEPGWPDLLLIRRGDRRLIFAECKTDKAASKLMPRQSKVLGLLCGLFGVDWLDPENRERWWVSSDPPIAFRVGVYVWRPSDAAEILEVLR